ncbi:hypothetical protein [Algoriphagus litoralis]|uniref:hypothetical protein n=1 Tax=Algoriphagus litoralis TaxID=2202829 RepID=UPI000DB98D43|nr:hypothetical protein [Algoriphagus litoralis]
MNLTLEIDYAKDELFDAVSVSNQNIYLWELLQGWMIFLAEREKSSAEVSERLFFFELLTQHLRLSQKDFERIPSDQKSRLQ